MTKIDFSQKINLPLEYLERLARRSKYLYQAFQIKKHNGSERQIESPNQELKGIQKWILVNILKDVELSDAVHGFRKKHSIRTNAMPHLGRNYLIIFDIKDFFPTVSKQDVVDNIRNKTSCDADLSEMIASLCIFNNHLPQGGVCSPCLANMVFSPIDDQIESICTEKRIVYTRYADDITISSNDKIRLQQVFSQILVCLNKTSFKVNERKTRFISKKGKMLITGITLNSGKLSIGRELKKLLRSQIYNYIIKKDTTKEHQLIGMLSYLKSIEPKTYELYTNYITELKKRNTEKT